jgi:Flp pilus assembly protein TadG
MKNYFRKLRKDDSGAITVIFVLTMMIVIGCLSLAVDVARVYNIEKKVSQINETIASAISLNLNFLGITDLEKLATDLADNIAGETSAFAFILGSSSVGTSVLTDPGRGLVTVTTTMTVPTTLLKFFSFSRNLNVSETVSAYQFSPEAEIMVVVESSEEMAQSGKLGNAIAGLREFIPVFDNHIQESNGVLFGFLPFGGELINVAPHIEWLGAGEWPTDIPPHVVGTTDWNGELADDRWCVMPREGLAGVNNITPNKEKFAVALEIQKTADDINLPHYSNVTTADCRKERIVPLSVDRKELLNELVAMEGSGDTYSGRALVWAERVLSEDWQPFWGNAAESPAVDAIPEISKIVILLIGSENTVPDTEDPLFETVCSRMKSDGVIFYVIDYLAPETITARLKNCATSKGHYFRVETGLSLSEALYSIAKFLTVVRFAG